MFTATTVAERGSHLLGDTHGLLTLLVRSPEHGGRILRIRSPKCVVGSHPSCTLRLCAAGVRPFHCLILRGREGMFIRRWSPDTCLNGAGFGDARLKPGDRLDIGPIELEVLELSWDDNALVPLKHPPTAVAPTAQNSTDPVAGESVQSPRDVQSAQDGGSPAEHSPPQVCQKCRQEREELESALALRVELGDQERGELTQKYVQLIGDLKRVEAARNDLLEDTEKQTDHLYHTRTDYREIIDELRLDLASLKQRHDVQLSEQAHLVAQAAEAEERATMLASQLGELQQQLREARTQLDGTTERLRIEGDEHGRQLAAARAELLQEQQSRQAEFGESESNRHELNEQLRRVQQQLADAMGQLESSHARSADLEARLAESSRQQQLSAETAQREADRVRQYEDELTVVRRELQEQQSQPWQQRQDEWESARQQLNTQLQQMQQRLDEATSQLAAAHSQTLALEAELQQRQRPVDSQELSPGSGPQRDEELATLQREFDEQRQLWQRQRERWESDERQLRGDAQEAHERELDAHDKFASAARQVTELESQLQEAARKLATVELTGQDDRRQRDENLAELSKWKDIAESMRLELQQERERHQCVRNEWHADRECLQRELSERSTSLEQVQTKHNQEMQEAEFLIHSLQQEGKQLLSQLDEAKQVIRKDIEKRKRTENQRTENQRTANQRTANQRTGDLAIGDDSPSRCQTMPMSPAGLGRAAAELSSNEPLTIAQGAAAADSTRLDPGNASDANHTIMMSPAEFAERGRRDDAADAAQATPQGEVAADQTPVVHESVDTPLADHEPAAEQCVAAESSVERPAEEGLTAVPPVIVEQTLVLDADDLSSCAMALVEETQADQPSPIEQAWSMLAAAPGESDENDEEGVIQRYMERLLKRVASQGRDGVDEAPVVRYQPKPAKQAGSASEAATTPVGDPATSSHVAPPGVGEGGSDTASTAGGESTSSSASRPATPEMAADLLAMRELANHSARHAIHSSDQRRFLTVAVGELVVASVCLASSCLLIAMSPRTLNSQTIGGAVGAAFGLSMFVRGFGKLFNCLRLKRALPAEAADEQREF